MKCYPQIAYLIKAKITDHIALLHNFIMKIIIARAICSKSLEALCINNISVISNVSKIRSLLLSWCIEFPFYSTNMNVHFHIPYFSVIERGRFKHFILLNLSSYLIRSWCCNLNIYNNDSYVTILLRYHLFLRKCHRNNNNLAR